MIVKMRKTMIVSRTVDRDRLLDSLRDLGVVHLTPVDPSRAVAKEQTVTSIHHLDRAIQILSEIEPAGDKGDIAPPEAADEVLNIHTVTAERHARLGALHRKLEHLEMWGDVRLKQFSQLRQAGLEIAFYALTAEQLAQTSSQLVHTIHELPDDRELVAVVTRTEGDEAQIPEDAQPVELPERDAPSIRAEAKTIDQALKADQQRLAALAHLTGEMKTTKAELEDLADYTIARRGGLTQENLFAIQGWAPIEAAQSLGSDLAKAGLDAAVEILEPAEDEDPPTLIRYPRWVTPISALFDMLGTNPGYREYDLAPFFMIALPIFAAMLIGDAGYGLLFAGLALFYRKKLSASAGKPAFQLILTIGILTLVWGVLTANYFGVTPNTFAEAGGWMMENETGQIVPDVQTMLNSETGGWAIPGKTMFALAPLYRIDFKAGLVLIMKISFLLGTLHLVTGQLRQVLGVFPDIRFMANVGWAIFLIGMLMLIWILFPFGGPMVPNKVMIGILAAGCALIVLFTCPNRNPLKWLGLGIASNLLPIIGAFSDSMSYIRLMAVGVASYFIAYSFNLLGSQVADGATWLVGGIVVVFGHALNIVLAVIAIFAHGVRLNMLEFSNNAGVQWSGYAFAPFKKRSV